jgi:hypothetical protein
MKIDREYQKNLLSFLLEDFPSYENSFEHCKMLADEDSDKYVANVEYLQRHGLLEDGVSLDFAMDGTPFVSIKAFPKITEAGIDFMLDDGGLSAILHVKTVKIHPDSIKALLEERVRASDLTDSDKSSLVQKIRHLPEASAKTLLDKLLDRGIDLLLDSASNLLDRL